MFGFVLFSTTALLPQITESLLGYSAMQSGLVIAPGGVAVILLMPVVGFLTSRVQPRNLVALGLAIEAISLYLFTGIDTQVDYSYLMWLRVFQASGLAFLFVPINTASYIGLPANKSNDASALMNLCRNLGGSFGISFAQTMVAHRSQFHQSRLVEGLTPYNDLYAHQLEALTQSLGSTDAARAMVMTEVQKQAAMLAYLDVFLIGALVAACCLPLILLVNRVQPGEPVHVGH